MFLKGGDGVGEIKKVEDRSEVTVIFRGDSVSCCGACCAWCLKVCFLIKMLCCGRGVCYLPSGYGTVRLNRHSLRHHGEEEEEAGDTGEATIAGGARGTTERE